MARDRITIALAGNPNSGKSSIYNRLTGARQHVGNYPGITVEKKEGQARYADYDLTIVDLPGTYSLSAHSEDERVARNYILHNKPDIVVHVVDASNLERNLYLFTQLAELNVPIIIAMNMNDVVKAQGHSVNYDEIALLLGKPVVPTVGSKGDGIEQLRKTVIDLYEGRIRPTDIHVDYGEEIAEELTKLKRLLTTHANRLNDNPVPWLALKLLEHDPIALDIVQSLPNADDLLNQIRHSRQHLQKHYGDDPEILIADRRYGFVSGVFTQTVKLTVEERHDLSDKIDKVILNRFLGIPIFALVMYTIFKFTFSLAEPMVTFFETIFDKLALIITTHTPESLTQSFIVDGIIGGVGGVLGFFPLVLFMFFAIAFFEDSGYMARAAFVMDRHMQRFGLHGKSFLPLMISTNGCAVPGLMASRTLETHKDRLITMMITPFMICGAKLPIFALFIGAFFSAQNGANIMFLMYTLSITIALASAWILKKFVFKQETSHFVIELPPYRVPTMQGLLLKMWERGWLYIKNAGTIILCASILIWAAFTFPHAQATTGAPKKISAATQMEQSIAGRFGKFIEPVIQPIGMDWRGGVAIIAGVSAKEVVVSTLGTMYSLGEVDRESAETLKHSLQNDPTWNPLKALSFLMFCLIYMPCVASMAVFYHESGSSWKWTSFLILWTTSMAWLAAFLVYQGGTVLGWGG